MANQNKLKAWVRYDGTNTVVTAGPIFRASKPKVGNWKEMNANLCCNSSTTTTTTNGGGSVTPTAWVAYTAFNPYSACQGEGGSSRIVYTSTSTIETGTIFYNDAALTELYNSNFYGNIVAINGTQYFLGDNGGAVVVSQGSCNPFTTTTTTTAGGGIGFSVFATYGSIGDACQQQNGQYVTVYAATPLANNVQIFMNAALTIPYDYAFGNLISAGNATYGVLNGYLANQTACYANSVYAGVGNTANEACTGAGSTMYLYYNNSYTLGLGVNLYTDGLLINEYNPGIYGSYVRLPINGQDQVSYMTGSSIQNYMPC